MISISNISFNLHSNNNNIIIVIISETIFIINIVFFLLVIISSVKFPQNHCPQAIQLDFHTIETMYLAKGSSLITLLSALSLAKSTFAHVLQHGQSHTRYVINDAKKYSQASIGWQ